MAADVSGSALSGRMIASLEDQVVIQVGEGVPLPAFGLQDKLTNTSACLTDPLE
jgi:hypothetical protein